MLQKFPMYAYIPANDVARARRFYEGKLGFKVAEETAGGVVLRARGIKFEDYDDTGLKTVNGVFEGGGAKAAWFKDSEGNIMALIEDAR